MEPGVLHGVLLLLASVMSIVLIPVMQEHGWFKNWPVWLIWALLLLNASMYVWAVALMLKLDIWKLLTKPLTVTLVSIVFGVIAIVLNMLAARIQERSTTRSQPERPTSTLEAIEAARTSVDHALTRGGAPPSKGNRPQETGPGISASEQAGVSATLAYIVEQYSKGDTTLQSERLVKPFIGKRIPVSGRVKNMEDWWPGDGVKVLLVAEQDIFVSARFEELWRDQLEAIAPGTTITLEGEISSAGRGYVVLKQCELTPPSLPSAS
jgi:hypothetical protein